MSKDHISGQCYFCPFVTNPTELPKHLLSHHKSRLRNHSCSRCDPKSNVPLSDILLIECQLSEQVRSGNPLDLSNLSTSWLVQKTNTPTKTTILCPFLHCSYSCCYSSKVIKHMKKEHSLVVNGVHFCQTCFFEGDRAQLINHLKKVHGISILLECNKCSFVTDRGMAFDEHSICKHPSFDNLFHCHCCNFSSKDSKKLFSHWLEVHRPPFNPYPCIFCPFSATDEPSLNNHLQSKNCYQNIASLNTPPINGSLNSRDTVINQKPTKSIVPVPTNEKIKAISCPFLLCSYSSPNPSECKSHIKTHYDSGIYVCSNCNFNCDNRDVLIVHFKNDHGIAALFFCDLCTHVSGDSVSYEEHVTFKHPKKKKKYACKSCTSVHASTFKLFDHMLRVHNALIFPFKCNKCNFSVQDELILLEHLSREHRVTYRLSRQPVKSLLQAADNFLLSIVKEQFKEFKDLNPEEHLKENCDEEQLKQHSNKKMDHKEQSCNKEINQKEQSKQSCNKEINQKKQLKQRFIREIKCESNTGDPNTFCPFIFCSFISSEISIMLKHVEDSHNVKLSWLSICSVCFLEKPSKVDLINHYLWAHNINRVFSCSHCTFIDPDVAMFNIHNELKHPMPNGFFNCSDCRHTFGSTEDLVSHKMFQHGTHDLFRCIKCSFSSDTVTKLREHSDVH